MMARLPGAPGTVVRLRFPQTCNRSIGYRGNLDSSALHLGYVPLDPTAFRHRAGPLPAGGVILGCRNLPFLAVFHVPGLWLLTDMKKVLEQIVRA
jgi:hypothetical protein